MNFTNFIDIVRDEVAKRTGENYKVKVNDVIKNNGVILSGLTIMKEGNNISPTIYLNTYYDAYENNQISLKCVIDNVMSIYEKNKVNQNIDMKNFLDYQYVKDRIIYKLINTEQNEKLLKDIPHIKFYDLSIVFQFLISEEKFTSSTILIHNTHLKFWNVSVDELYERAQKNTPVLNNYYIKSVKDTINEMIFEQDEEYADEFNLENNNIPMYVLSNSRRINGAACMLYPDLIKDFSTAVNSNLYIIPSSVHELLLLPTDDSSDYAGIKEMIKEINDTEVTEEEVLSYSVYYYDKSKDKVSVL